MLTLLVLSITMLIARGGELGAALNIQVAIQ